MGGIVFSPSGRVAQGTTCPPLTLLAFAKGSDLSICPLTPTIDSLVRVSRRVRDGRAALLPHPAAACCVSKAGDHSPATFRSASAAQSGRARRDLRLPAADHRRSTVLATTASASPTTISHPFHPLSKVLFIFPSRYLFAIGLLPIFSLRCDLPPALGCIPKQPDSSAAGRQLVSLRHGALTLSGAAFQQTHTATPISPARLHSTTPIAGFPKLSSSRFTRRYWGNHCYFLLLRLLICLSSAGRLACLRPDWSLSRVLPHDNRGAFHRAARPAQQYYYHHYPALNHTCLPAHAAFKYQMSHTCKSHCFSHLAAFFIVARAQRSIVESLCHSPTATRPRASLGWKQDLSLLPHPQSHTPTDPSAGSPTETLLRLLLPLDEGVWACSGPEYSSPPHYLTLTSNR